MKKQLQHYLNPMHVMCRLCDIGFGIKTAHKIAGVYERIIFVKLHLVPVFVPAK
jgi:hypothetical protein